MTQTEENKPNVTAETKTSSVELTDKDTKTLLTTVNLSPDIEHIFSGVCKQALKQLGFRPKLDKCHLRLFVLYNTTVRAWPKQFFPFLVPKKCQNIYFFSKKVSKINFFLQPNKKCPELFFLPKKCKNIFFYYKKSVQKYILSTKKVS